MGNQVSEQAPAELILEEAHPDHAYCLAPRLRAADLEEFSYTFSPQFPDAASILVTAIEESYSNPDAKVFTISDEEGRLHGLWGFSTWSSPTFVAPIGSVWLCSDDELFGKYKKLVTRVARDEIFPALDRRFAGYGNLVYARNLVHVRWLARAGFRRYATCDRQGAPFYLMMRSNRGK